MIDTQEPPMTYSEEDKLWIPATPKPYHPNLIEKIRHLLGIHLYPEYDEKAPHGEPQCLVCYKYK